MRLIKTSQHFKLEENKPDYDLTLLFHKGYHNSYVFWLPRYMLAFSYIPGIHQ